MDEQEQPKRITDADLDAEVEALTDATVQAVLDGTTRLTWWRSRMLDQRMAREILNLRDQVRKLNYLCDVLADPPMTLEQAEEAYKVSEPVPMEEAQIQRIMDAVKKAIKE